MKKDEMNLISDIANRALADIPALAAQTDKMSLFMDIDYTHQINPLRLSELLAADPGNFAHDIIGIHNHFDRNTKTLTDCFSPRFSA